MIHFCIKRNLQCEHAGSVSVLFVGKFHSNARNNRQHFLQAEIGQQYQFALDKSITYDGSISLSSQRLRNNRLCLIADMRVKEALHRLLYVTRIQS